MHFADLPSESRHLSLVLNASCISLPLVKLRQNTSKCLTAVQTIYHQRPEKTIIVGSRAEGLSNFDREESEQLSLSDSDVLVINNTYKVYEHIGEQERAAEDLNPKLNHRLRLPDETCPGYSKLAVIQISSNLTEHLVIEDALFLKNNIKEVMWKEDKERFRPKSSIHGPAVRTVFTCESALTIIPKVVDTLPFNVADIEGYHFASVDQFADFVPCLRGDTWPVEACEWTKRRRLFSWPAQTLIHNIIKSGYVLAGV
ncbi:unnamed protein product [Mytilus coruscus]|uniref:Uncharacterized protein n=1 Tax=Mytilus coruscus TaxID=42192 RepID=A0A6J8AXJ6_MYTCO|nr:unnamed protein product [Mytilus coruscus]